MRWLFALFLLSLCTLLWAAFAMARHIRRASVRLPRQSSPAVVEVAQNVTGAESEKQAAVQQENP